MHLLRNSPVFIQVQVVDSLDKWWPKKKNRNKPFLPSPWKDVTIKNGDCYWHINTAICITLVGLFLLQKYPSNGNTGPLNKCTTRLHFRYTYGGKKILKQRKYYPLYTTTESYFQCTHGVKNLKMKYCMCVDNLVFVTVIQ